MLISCPNAVELIANWVIFHDFYHRWIFFEIHFFLENTSGILSECQTVWIQIKPDVLSGLFWGPNCLQMLSGRH